MKNNEGKINYDAVFHDKSNLIPRCVGCVIINELFRKRSGTFVLKRSVAERSDYFVWKRFFWWEAISYWAKRIFWLRKPFLKHPVFPEAKNRWSQQKRRKMDTVHSELTWIIWKKESGTLYPNSTSNQKPTLNSRWTLSGFVQKPSVSNYHLRKKVDVKESVIVSRLTA